MKDCRVSGLVRGDCQAKKFINWEKRMTECLSVMKMWNCVEGRRVQLEELPLVICYPRGGQGAPSEVGRQPSYRVKEAGGFWLDKSLPTGIVPAVMKEQGRGRQ